MNWPGPRSLPGWPFAAFGFTLDVLPHFSAVMLSPWTRGFSTGCCATTKVELNRSRPLSDCCSHQHFPPCLSLCSLSTAARSWRTEMSSRVQPPRRNMMENSDSFLAMCDMARPTTLARARAVCYTRATSLNQAPPPNSPQLTYSPRTPLYQASLKKGFWGGCHSTIFGASGVERSADPIASMLR